MRVRVDVCAINFCRRNISNAKRNQKGPCERSLESRTISTAKTHSEVCTACGHSVCELLTTRSCIRCTRCIHTHTHTWTRVSSHTTPTGTPSFPTDRTHAFSQLDVRIRSAHLWLLENVWGKRTSESSTRETKDHYAIIVHDK